VLTFKNVSFDIWQVGGYYLHFYDKKKKNDSKTEEITFLKVLKEMEEE